MLLCQRLLHLLLHRQQLRQLHSQLGVERLLLAVTPAAVHQLAKGRALAVGRLVLVGGSRGLAALPPPVLLLQLRTRSAAGLPAAGGGVHHVRALLLRLLGHVGRQGAACGDLGRRVGGSVACERVKGAEKGSVTP